MAVEETRRTLRRAGGWTIVMGVTSIVVGLGVGIGCVVAGGALLSRSHRV